MKKIVIFGAGKIGRSFIGQVFSLGGYEVVFVEADRDLVSELNNKQSYRVIIKSESGNQVLTIKNIRGIHTSERAAIINEVAGVTLLATCVGPANLPGIVPFITGGIKLKKERGIDCKTDLIIAENLRNAASHLRKLFINEFHDAGFVESNIGLIETSIGKMVPIMTRKDIDEDRLQVFAEPYNTLILDEKAFRNPIPEVKGLAPKKNMKAWVDRKSFIHNLGHAAGAYYSYIKNPGREYFYQVMEDQECRGFTRETMLQSAEALLMEYPGEFARMDLVCHIEDLLSRFQNRALGDTVFRVGLDLYRKLGPEDRLVGAIRMASKHGLPFDRIAYALACGFEFRGTDEAGNLYPADAGFISEFSNKDPEYLIKTCCGIDPSREKNIYAAIMNSIDQLRSASKTQSASMKIFSEMPGMAEMKQIAFNYAVDPVLSVNAHFHTPYSFSAFSEIEEVFILSRRDHVEVLGINDFITTAGYEEFGNLSKKYRCFPLFNIEFMGLMPEEQQKGIRINDPDNPGRIYFCGKGLVRPDRISQENKARLEQVFRESLNQIREMTERLNDRLVSINSPFKLDFNIIQKKFTKGLVRERHLVKALRMELRNHFPEESVMRKFLEKLYNGQQQKAPISDDAALDNELRSKLLKKGGPAFVPEKPAAFLSLDAIKEIILDAGGIPCYPVLLDNDKGDFTEFEKNYAELHNCLVERNIYSVELIPGRNDFNRLRDFVRFFNDRNFLITFGTEHNTPSRPPMTINCRHNTPLTDELNKINFRSACVIAAHQFFVSKGEPGYVEKNGTARLEKKEEFVRFGNAVIRHFINS